jgi:hypothetical protein
LLKKVSEEPVSGLTPVELPGWIITTAITNNAQRKIKIQAISLKIGKNSHIPPTLMLSAKSIDKKFIL